MPPPEGGACAGRRPVPPPEGGACAGRRPVPPPRGARKRAGGVSGGAAISATFHFALLDLTSKYSGVGRFVACLSWPPLSRARGMYIRHGSDGSHCAVLRTGAGARFSIGPSSPLSFETCSRRRPRARCVCAVAAAGMAEPVAEPRAFNIGQPSISAPGSAWSRDYPPVRVGSAFGIAPCVKLWAKEFGGVAPDIKRIHVRVANV